MDKIDFFFLFFILGLIVGIVFIHPVKDINKSLIENHDVKEGVPLCLKPEFNKTDNSYLCNIDDVVKNDSST